MENEYIKPCNRSLGSAIASHWKIKGCLLIESWKSCSVPMCYYHPVCWAPVISCYCKFMRCFLSTHRPPAATEATSLFFGLRSRVPQSQLSRLSEPTPKVAQSTKTFLWKITRGKTKKLTVLLIVPSYQSVFLEVSTQLLLRQLEKSEIEWKSWFDNIFGG